jgi:hypothetical protein
MVKGYRRYILHDLQHIKERKPGLLKRVRDDNEKDYILHIGYQSNDRLMACRMAEYNAMLRRMHKVPPKHPIKP